MMSVGNPWDDEAIHRRYRSRKRAERLAFWGILVPVALVVTVVVVVVGTLLVESL